MIRSLAVLALAAVLAPPVLAGEVPEATLVLEATVGVPATLPSAAPPRFLLRRDNSVFVGGSEQIYSGLLDKDEVKALERRVNALRKSGALGPSVSFGDDTTKRYRLRLLEDGARDVVITGDPANAPPELQALALLVSDLESFDHPSLRPWPPAEYAVSAREGCWSEGAASGCSPCLSTTCWPVPSGSPPTRRSAGRKGPTPPRSAGTVAATW